MKSLSCFLFLSFLASFPPGLLVGSPCCHFWRCDVQFLSWFLCWLTTKNSHHSFLFGINNFIVPLFTFQFILIQHIKLHFSFSWIKMFPVLQLSSNFYLFVLKQLLLFSCKYSEYLDVSSYLYAKLHQTRKIFNFSHPKRIQELFWTMTRGK